MPVKQKYVFQIVIYVENNDWQKCVGNAIAGEKVSPTKENVIFYVKRWKLFKNMLGKEFILDKSISKELLIHQVYTKNIFSYLIKSKPFSLNLII